MHQALRHSGFARLFWATLISQAGSKIHRVALLVLVYMATSQPIWVALVLAMQLAASVGLGPLLAPWADSRDRRALLVWTDLVRAGLVPLAPLAAATALPLLLLLVVVLEALRVVHDALALAVVPDLVPPEAADGANGLMLFAERLSEVAFVGLAGLLVAALGATTAFWIDAATYLVAGLLLRGLPALARVAPASASYWAQARAGIGHIWASPAIRRTVLVLAAAAMFGSVEALLGLVLAIEVLGVGAPGFGLMEAAMALGAVLGTLLAPWLLARLARERLFALGLLAFGLAEASLGLLPVFAWALIACLLGGIANMAFVVPTRSILQLHTPSELRGRVFAAYGAIMSGAVLFGTMLAGLLADPLGPTLIFSIAGFAVAAIAAGELLRQLRPRAAAPALRAADA